MEHLEQRSLLSAASLINLDLLGADSRFTDIDGSGYTAVVIDTGADLNHPYFGADHDGNGVADRIVYQYDFADRDADASDGSGTSHGSHVTGIIGAADATYGGVAPDANLVVLKVFHDGGGSADMADIEAALDWVDQNVAAYNIVAVNMSLGADNYDTSQTGFTLTDEFERLHNKGVILVAASGNQFFTEQSEPGVSYPAADPHVLAVGAVWADDYGPQTFESAADNATAADRVAAYSQRHPTLTDILAPGGLVTSTDRNGGTITRRGTSMAAPFVTGAAVLAQQLADRELGRRLSPAEFRDLVVSTAITVHDGDDEDDNVVNTNADYPRLNVLAMAETQLASPSPPTLTIDALTITEGTGGLSEARVRVRLTRSPANPVSVDFHTLDGAARADLGDYVAASGTLVFAPGGATVQTITVLLGGDVLPEPEEYFAVDLTNAVGATIGRSRGVIVVKDDDQILTYHNSVNSRDVNGDGRVSALDALIVINEINARGARQLPNPPTPRNPWYFYDVNADGRITALDALVVINHLNARPSGSQTNTAAGQASDDAAIVAGVARSNSALPPATAAAKTGTTVASAAADAVFSLAGGSTWPPFPCKNRTPVYAESYRRQGLPRSSS